MWPRGGLYRRTEKRPLCHLKQDACETKLNITLKYYGKCDPCDGHVCAVGTTCKIGQHRRPECRCSQQCPLHRSPVCGSDGQTYENDCVMKVAACREDRQITVWKEGNCKDVGNPCSSLMCPPGTRCQISPQSTAKCECDGECPQIVKPVCATDGKTYSNECEMRKAGCEATKRLAVRHTGSCGVGVCSTFTGCRAPQVCVPKGDKPRCVCPECGDELKEVCGSDAQTYANECRLRQTSCKTGQSLFVKYNGICEGCEKLRDKCEFYSICVSDGKGTGTCQCPIECPVGNHQQQQQGNSNGKEGPVCGTDGVTYSSECHLRRSACQRRKFVVVAFAGKCDACQNVECGYGQECRGGVCTCNYHCPVSAPDSSRVCEILNSPPLDRSHRQKTLLAQNPQNRTIGSTCSYQSECAHLSAICHLQRGKAGRCQCAGNSRWDGKSCGEEAIALPSLNLRFDGRQTANVANIDRYSGVLNVTLQFSAAASNGALIDVLMVVGKRMQLRVDQRRLLLQ
ncbi:unnamed protein product, partial [Mesorhabditis spiculigera]